MEKECYEEEFQPYQKTDYKPIIYNSHDSSMFTVYLYVIRSKSGLLLKLFNVLFKCFLRICQPFDPRVNTSTEISSCQ